MVAAKNARAWSLSAAGVLVASITASAPSRAAANPSPVVRSTPVERASTTAACPDRRSAATVSRPTSPVPPATPIFMTTPFSRRSMTG